MAIYTGGTVNEKTNSLTTSNSTSVVVSNTKVAEKQQSTQAISATNAKALSSQKELLSYWLKKYNTLKSIYEWTYPESFKTERSKAFELLKKLDAEADRLGTFDMSSSPLYKPVKVESKAFVETMKGASNYYIGEEKNNRPDGFGMIFNYQTFVPKFIGYFKKGKPSGYGMLLDGDGNIVWECSSAAYDGKNFSANGKGILYCNYDMVETQQWGGISSSTKISGLTSETNEKRWNFYTRLLSDACGENSTEERKFYEANEHLMVDVPLGGEEDGVECFFKFHRIVLKPVVGYEGELKNTERHGKGKLYYDAFQKKTTGEFECDPYVKGVYGQLHYDGEFSKGQLSGKGKLYYYSGKIFYDGQFKNNTEHGKGTMYNEDGSVKYKGKFKNGDIA